MDEPKFIEEAEAENSPQIPGVKTVEEPIQLPESETPAPSIPAQAPPAPPPPPPAPRNPKIDALNYWGVMPYKDAVGDGIQFRRYPPPRVLGGADALVVAAWIVRTVDPSGRRFSEVFDEVKKEPGIR